MKKMELTASSELDEALARIEDLKVKIQNDKS